MSKNVASTSSIVFLILFSFVAFDHAKAKFFGEEVKSLVKREQREVLADNEFGRITAVNISDGNRGLYHMRFFTLEPNSLLLPVLLHADMVLYVNTGSGMLSWANEEESKTVNLKRGDIYRLQTGSLFFVQSDLETERQSLRLYALFSNTDYDLFEPQVGAYSSVRDLVRGFDKATLKQAFQVSDEVIESITSASETEPIVHAISKKKDDEKEKKKKKGLWAMESRFLKAFLGLEGQEEMVNNKKGSKGETYNIFEESPDFENCNGWSVTVSPKRAEHVLGESNVGIFMVNLTKGSMMGPHWNPKATEVAVVLHGQGMVRVVCSSRTRNRESECKNMRFMVKEGDAFVVPRFHPMAQLSFNNDSFVFMGFATTRRENHPQFLAGRQSVLQALDRDILALSFNVPNTTIDQILTPQSESVILDCTSCAEEEERKMEEEEEEEAREREKEEEERRKREEEARKREEEERRKREEEEARKREEEEAQKQEEEEARKREEEERRKREEEEAREREEEERRKREEEEAREREEEEARKREEEEAREREEEEARKREEEEAREREEEEARKREEEEERERERREEEEARRQEEQERRDAEEAAKRERQQEEEQKRARREAEEEEEEEEARKREEERERERREEEEARRQEEEREREQAEARRQEEAARRQEQERRAAEEAAERARQQEEEQERARQEAEEAAAREREEEGGGGEAPK